MWEYESNFCFLELFFGLECWQIGLFNKEREDIVMQFPDRNAMSLEDKERNAAAVLDLVRGGTYRFTPPVEATGIPTGGPEVHEATMLTFVEGWYIGFIDGNHVFQGKPTDDPRSIPTPRGYESAPNLREIKDQLRECYFLVSFIGGSVAELVRPTA